MPNAASTSIEKGALTALFALTISLTLQMGQSDLEAQSWVDGALERAFGVGVFVLIGYYILKNCIICFGHFKLFSIFV